MGLLGMRGGRAFRMYQLQLETSSSYIIIISIRIKFRTRGAVCDLTKPSLCVDHQGPNSQCEIKVLLFYFVVVCLPAFDGMGSREHLLVKSVKTTKILYRQASEARNNINVEGECSGHEPRSLSLEDGVQQLRGEDRDQGREIKSEAKII